jgi:hypothetical protein
VLRRSIESAMAKGSESNNSVEKLLTLTHAALDGVISARRVL